MVVVGFDQAHVGLASCAAAALIADAPSRRCAAEWVPRNR